MTDQTKGRKAMPAAVVVPAPTNDQAVASAGAALTVIGEARSAIGGEQITFSQRVGSLIGRRTAIEAMQKLVTVTEIVELQAIKNSKEYKDLRVLGPNGLVTVTSWEDFCTNVVGRSREAVDLDLANLKAFGAEMLEALQNMGLGYRQMRELRAVPADERTKLLEAAKSGDATKLVEAAEDLIERHAADRKELATKLQKAEKAVADKQRVIELKEAKNTELTEQLVALQSSLVGQDEQTQLDAVRDAGVAAEMAIRQLLATVVEVTDAPASEACGTAARHGVEFVCQVMADLLDKAGINVQFEQRVSAHWLTGLTPAATPTKAG